MHRRVLLGRGLGGAAVAVYAAGGPELKPDLYEVTVQMEMPDMPQKMPAQTTAAS